MTQPNFHPELVKQIAKMESDEHRIAYIEMIQLVGSQIWRATGRSVNAVKPTHADEKPNP